ncbi:hypothetical protein LSAT2_011388 [Lamellibrachia satsuma]|nr:hypothetical protein LSAT2_011388 [Lamellibrachia satsuma]
MTARTNKDRSIYVVLVVSATKDRSRIFTQQSSHGDCHKHAFTWAIHGNEFRRLFSVTRASRPVQSLRKYRGPTMHVTLRQRVKPKTEENDRSTLREALETDRFQMSNNDDRQENFPS